MIISTKMKIPIIVIKKKYYYTMSIFLFISDKYSSSYCMHIVYDYDIYVYGVYYTPLMCVLYVLPGPSFSGITQF